MIKSRFLRQKHNPYALLSSCSAYSSVWYIKLYLMEKVAAESENPARNEDGESVAVSKWAETILRSMTSWIAEKWFSWIETAGSL